MNMSSILQLNKRAILNARPREGLYLSFSIAEIVCLLIFNFSAISCCVQSFSARNTFKRFFILITAIIMITSIVGKAPLQERQSQKHHVMF